MKFETKFNVGDSVWTLYENKAKLAEINTIEVKQSNMSFNIPLSVKYYLNVGTEKNYLCSIVDENNCFETREQLIESL